MKQAKLYMLDTNIASFMIRGMNTKLETKVRKISINSLCISTITQAELLYGLERKPHASTLKQLVEQFLIYPNILSWDSNAAEQYSVLRANLEKKGTPLSNLDTMIAAHALSVNAILVTNDNAFSRINKLRIEDWSS